MSRTSDVFCLCFNTYNRRTPHPEDSTTHHNRSIFRKQRRMVGRIMLVKSLIIPNITHAASATNIDKENISEFKIMIYNFIWNDNREKVKRETMNKNYLEGGGAEND